MPRPQAFPDRRAAPLSGQIGRYDIVRRLAVGGMAEVYLARVRGQHGFARSVVLKRIRPELSRTGQFQRMFADEARVAAHLSHVNIAQVLDVGEENGESYLVMEYVDGRDVHALLADAGGAGLPIHVAAAIAMGVAAGLDHAHRRRDADGRPLDIVHRDVSPSNVMVAFDGNVKLLDFGVAKAQGAREVTRAGTVKGKVEYMSPEQALGLAVDQRSDLFSLGTLLFELLVGARPYDDGPVVVPPGRRRSGIPAALDALVMRLLAHEPARRPASAEEVSGALDAIAREEKLSCSPVALRRYLVERFGEPESTEVAEPIRAEERETASVSVAAPVTATATAEVTAIDEVVSEVPLGTPVPLASPAPPVRVGRRLLLVAAAAVGAIALVLVMAAGRESRAERPRAVAPPAAPVKVAVPPAAAAAPAPVVVSLPAPREIADPEPEPARPAARKRRAPVKSAPVATPPEDWDPDSPLLRSQQRRLRP
ncbi:MAG TPA: serine/threonine-protein kinase [Kofleriaceae bacterium]|nr:serine/threonine-protein kinase [Kofleriaceae bacterium]